MDSACLLSDKTWLEKYFRATEAFAANGNYIPIWKFIGFLLIGTFGGSFHLSIEVQCNVAQLFFHIAHDLALSGRRERIATLRENFHQIFCEVPTCKVKPKNGMW